MDFYKVLGVEKNASEGDIKKAYRKFAHQYHPDSGGGGDEKKFKEVTEAYEVLGDKQKRAQYDQFGHVGKGAPGRGGGGWGGFGDFNVNDFQNVHFDFGENFGDIFDTFFGGGERRRAKTGSAKGSDMEILIHVTFEEAVFGVTKSVEISRMESCSHCEGKGAEPGTEVTECETCSGTGHQIRVQRTPLGQIQTASTCSACHGAGRVAKKKCKHCKGEGRTLVSAKLQIKIPAGIGDKAVIRLREQGEVGAQGGETGDLFVHVSVLQSREFERVGEDIHTTLHIPLLQAVLGAEVKVKTVHGETLLKIPAGTQHGKSFKLKGKGVPRVNSDHVGDHVVKVEVGVPEKLSRRERELYETLARESKINYSE
ncbi:MAG: molecular chaperone DnaJ [Candidatus Peregrinibacteria bacterium]